MPTRGYPKVKPFGPLNIARSCSSAGVWGLGLIEFAAEGPDIFDICWCFAKYDMSILALAKASRSPRTYTWLIEFFKIL